jgi:hypothetical protein
MDWHELEKMKVTDLRELAKEKTELEGVTGLHKDQLVEELATVMGIEKPHKVIEAGQGKRRIKAQIRELKVAREQALAAGNAQELRKLRRKIHGLKRRLRGMAHLTH